MPRQIIGAIASAVRNRFYDTFNRSNTTGDLGTATDGSLWDATSGTWTVVANQAQATTSASSYPVASVALPKNNMDISLKGVGNGAGAALWVTDSGNWWGVVVDQEQETAYNTCQGANCNAYTYTIQGYNCSAYSCSAYSFYCVTGYTTACNHYARGNCNRYNATNRTCQTYNAGTCDTWSSYCGFGYNVCNANSCSSPGNTNGVSNCNAFTTYYYNCNPYTVYPSYLRVIQSVSNTVSTIASTAISSVAQALKVSISGTQLTTKAYSDSAMTTQIGSDWVYTPTGVTVTPKYGIVLSPTNYSQGTTIDEVDITLN